MNNLEIQEKAIEKAEKNGFDNHKINCFHCWDTPPCLYVRFLLCKDFAEAFFSCNKCDNGFIRDEKGDTLCSECHGNFIKGWKLHLKEMVMYDEPLLYLEKFL